MYLRSPYSRCNETLNSTEKSRYIAEILQLYYRNCIFALEKSPFRDTEYAFRTSEWPFRVTEWRFRITERRFL
jgi:hypothetical protein